MACKRLLLRFAFFAWAGADASLKHMRAHGHDEKNSKAVEVHWLIRALSFQRLRSSWV